MFRLLFIFLVTVITIAFAPLLVGHQGVVTITLGSKQYITSVTVLVMAIVLLIFLIFFIQWIIRSFHHFTTTTTGWFLGRGQERSRKQTRAGLLRMIEGDYIRAEKLFKLSANHSDFPLINYLMAADASQRRNDIIATNQYLEQAEQVAGNNQLAVEISRINIQFEHGAYEIAHYNIEQLLQKAPRHPEVLRLAGKIYIQTKSYRALLDILPAMEKIALYDDAHIEEMRLLAYKGIMQQEVGREGSDGLKRWLTDLPKNERRKPEIRYIIASLFIRCKDYDMAEEVILTYLKQQYDEPIASLLRDIVSNDIEKFEKSVNKLVHKYGENSVFNSALGTIAIQREQWENACNYLEKALTERPDIKDYAQLACAYDALSQTKNAAEARKKGLNLALNPKKTKGSSLLLQKKTAKE